MLDEHTSADAEPNQTTDTPDAPAPETEAAAPRKRAPRKRAAKKTAPPAEDAGAEAPPEGADSGEPRPAKKAAARRTPRKRAASAPSADAGPAAGQPATDDVVGTAPPENLGDVPVAGAGTEGATADLGAATVPGAPLDTDDEARRTPAKKTAKRTAKKSAKKSAAPAETGGLAEAAEADGSDTSSVTAKAAPATTPLFQPPPSELVADDAVAPLADDEEDAEDLAPGAVTAPEAGAPDAPAAEETGEETGEEAETEEDSEAATRRRRRRGGRRRRKGGGADAADGPDAGDTADEQDDSAAPSGQKSATKQNKGGDRSPGSGPEESADGDTEGGSTRRRRRRRRSGDGGDGDSDDPENTVTRVRRTRSAEDEITSFSGSTRLEAKKQRRREGREAGRRRAPIISEAEFLARREAVDRMMVIRQRGDLTQIAVLEDKVLVEHYVARESQTSLIGNVYLGRVQNVLPSMEAAFIDIGKGRNAVLYAGEVNWDSFGAKDGHQRKIEQVLKPGQSVLVQVSKDPMGHKGARLTSQISLPGRFLVYVPDGTTSGISRKLPENERNRLKNLLKEIVPETAGVIVRTAAEGASEAELTRDVERLTALWDDISSKVEGGGSSSAPQLLYGEPDLTLKVVRDLFTEDFGRLVVSGEDAWDMVQGYVEHVAPDLVDRLERHDDTGGDAFAAYRIDEQIAKALDHKVWLPSGGSLIIDRTEAMTVVDVNTGKFTGSGGNLEETVTKNNLEAAEEIVRQLRLRDIGGIIVVDFIDMVLENNRDLVLRRLIECLGRDRTRHQVAEVTSLGLVQMTRKRIGTGLLEAFSEVCECCQGRGLHVREEPVEAKRKVDDEPRRGRRNRGRGGRDDEQDARPQTGHGGNGNGRRQSDAEPGVRRPSPAEFAAMARADASRAERASDDPESTEEQPAELRGTAEPVEPLGTGEPDPTGPAEPEPASRTLPQDAEVPQIDEAAAQPDPSMQPDSPAGGEAAELQSEAEPSPPPAPVVPSAPRLVTSVRRVGARRAAGPPSVPRQEATDEQTAEPTEAPGEASGEVDAVELRDADAVEELAEQPHVPVKKRGSRKR